MPEANPPFRPLRPRELLIAAISGALLALSFPGVDWAVLAWVALVPFALVIFRPRRKRAMTALFSAFGGGFYLVLLYWFLAMHPLTWLGFSEGQSLGIVSFAWLGASFALMAQLAGFGYVYGWLTRTWQRPSAAHVLALALGWVALEWTTSLGMFGFTWGNLALTQYQNLPFLQALDLVGPFPLAGLIVAVNGALALAVMRRAEAERRRGAWKPVAVALAPVVAVLGYGAARLAQPMPEPSFSVEIVQGNLAGGEKWARGKDALTRMADKYLKLTAENPKTDLVLWPETAMPTYVRNDRVLYERLQSEARAQGRFLMTGTLDWEGIQPDLKLYNAVTAFSPRGGDLGFDYKRHLVPFGEYVPFRDVLPPALLEAVGLVNILGVDYYPGVRPHIFQFPFAKIGAGVCYDGIFPDAIRPAVLAGADVLALVTNDAWYKDTTAPRVLNAHAVLRAVENRRYVLRAANTGISSIISPTGNIVGKTPVYQDATLVGRAAPMTELTLYTRYGDWASALASLGFLGLLFNRWKNRRRRTA